MKKQARAWPAWASDDLLELELSDSRHGPRESEMSCAP